MKLYMIKHPAMHTGTRWFRTITNAKIAARNIKAGYLARRIPEKQRVAVVIECVNLGSINADVLVNILNGATFIQERVTVGPVAPEPAPRIEDEPPQEWVP